MIFDTPTPARPEAERTHPTFGRLICRRRYGVHYLIPAAFLFIFSLLPTALIVAVALTPPHPPVRHKFGPPQSPGQSDRDGVYIFGAVTQVLCLPLVWAACYTGSRPFLRFDLWESGVTASRLGREYRAVPYSDCRKFRYRIVRRYVKGKYVGTTVSAEFRAIRQRIAFTVLYKERYTGPIFTLSLRLRKFESFDEMELVKQRVSASMADAWLSTPSPEFVWGKAASLSTTGLTPLRGLYAGRHFPYESVSRIEAKGNSIRLWSQDTSKPITRLRMQAPNFWPGLEIFRALCPAASAAAHAEPRRIRQPAA